MRRNSKTDGRTLRITEVSIKNFRSIRSLSLRVNGFTVISGLNDAGKSNILKALNLFFNGKTDADKEFNFEEDYCLSAPVQKKKAKKIEISLTFRIPENFKDKDKGDVIWTKTWYRNGKKDERKSVVFSPRSKVGMLFHRIKYRYVPAVKSETYFKSLLKDLYASLAKDVDSELAKKTNEYSGTIKKYTVGISNVVNEQFHIHSNLEYPQDQSAIFKELQFVTNNVQGCRISLSHRGDGVQTAHIPAILQFIAEKDNEGLGSNSILCSTFWGYEEPENGLEMLRCYGMAESLLNVSSQIQMFVTSHSPAFFSAGRREGASAFWVNQDVSGETVVTQCRDEVASLGYMPMIAPIVESHRHELEKRDAEIDRLKKVMQSALTHDVDTIMVEGVTDRDYLTRAISILSPKLKLLLEDGELRIYCREDNGGTSNLVRYAEVWNKSKMKKQLIVLLDDDRPGKEAAKEICQLANQTIKAIRIPLAPWIKRIYDVVVEQEELDAVIETLFPVKVWEKLKDSNLLCQRPVESLSRMFAKLAGLDKTIQSAIASSVSESDRIYVDYVPRRKKKKAIAKVVLSMAEGDSEVWSAFKILVDKIEKEIVGPDPARGDEK